MSISASTQNSQQESNLFIPIGAYVTLHDDSKVKAVTVAQIVPKLQSMAEKNLFFLSILSDASLGGCVIGRSFACENISSTTISLLSQTAPNYDDSDSEDESSKILKIDPKVCSVIKNPVFINKETFETVVLSPIKKA